MDKNTARVRRARATRAKIAELRAVRLTVHRSNAHIYAQVIDQDGARVLATASTREAEVRQELSLRTVAHGGQSVSLTETHEGREVHVAGDVLLPDVPVRIFPNGVPVVAHQRIAIVSGGVEVGGLLTVVDRQHEAAIERARKLPSPVFDHKIHLAAIAFRQTRLQTRNVTALE